MSTRFKKVLLGAAASLALAGGLVGATSGSAVAVPATADSSAAATETWNDANFTGTYGYFAPWNTWSLLSYPYNDAIT
ncbi:hypothetical protein OHA88_43265 [Streptomyces sp. NBC_00353]|uniref:hypothetical protein n=1 Tax=Streptomyces sp. NBC_00353 TaxID=2975722 RepID=UPI002E254860